VKKEKRGGGGGGGGGATLSVLYVLRSFLFLRGVLLREYSGRRVKLTSLALYAFKA